MNRNISSEYYIIMILISRIIDIAWNVDLNQILLHFTIYQPQTAEF
jgi:hypothetical protein